MSCQGLREITMTLEIKCLDLRTLQEIPDMGVRVDNSYLEYWLSTHCLAHGWDLSNFKIYQAEYLPSSEVDHQEVCTKLKTKDLYLTFVNGSKLYITGKNLYELLLKGDSEKGIRPAIYGGNDGRDSVHNAVAYGSLLVSNGTASLAIQRKVRALVVNDEAESIDEFLGDSLENFLGENLRNREGGLFPGLSPEQAKAVIREMYARIGDGTLLLSPRVASQLIQDKRELNRVHQFRAGSIDYTGVLKGTFQVSDLCKLAGLDLVIGQNCIKMNQPELSSLGIKEFNSFWINRKISSYETTQEVGPQVQSVLPKATSLNFTDKAINELSNFVSVARDPLYLLEDYLKTNEDQQDDYVVRIANGDPRRVLLSSSLIQSRLESYLRGRFLFYATHGITVPSAMAQPYRRLYPWEVINPQFPHGAVLVYYRSPLVSGSALTIAINNLALAPSSTELGKQRGIAYLPFWTAKNVAITDFDGDRNGFFYTHLSVDLPDYLRSFLIKRDFNAALHLGFSSVQEAEQFLRQNLEEEISPEAYYNAFLAVMERQLNKQLLVETDYPVVLEEVIQIHKEKITNLSKDKKQKFLCEREHYEDIWLACSAVAENKIGIVSNNKMSLDALANECLNVYRSNDEAQITKTYAEIRNCLEKIKSNNLIPDDNYLTGKGFVFEGLTEKDIKDKLGRFLDTRNLEDSETRRNTIFEFGEFLKKVSNTLVGKNQQIAVDGQKSAKLVDEVIHNFTSALEYKKVEFIRDKDDAYLYKNGKTMKVTTLEPVAERITKVNSIYEHHYTIINEFLSEYRNFITINGKMNRDYFIVQMMREIIKEKYGHEYFESLKRNDRFNQIVQVYWRLVDSKRALQRLEDEIAKRDKDKRLPLRAYFYANLLGISSYLAPDQNVIDVENGTTKPGRLMLKFVKNNQNSVVNEHGFLFIYQKIRNESNYSLVGISAGSKTLEEFREIIKNSDRSVREYKSSEGLFFEYDFIKSNEVKDLRVLNIEIEKKHLSQRVIEFIKDKAKELYDNQELNDFIAYMCTDLKTISVAMSFFPDEVTGLVNSYDSIGLIGTNYADNEVKFLEPGEYDCQASKYFYTNRKGEQVPRLSISVNLNGSYYHYGCLTDQSLRFPEGTRLKVELLSPQNSEQKRLKVLSYSLPSMEVEGNIGAASSRVEIISTSVSGGSVIREQDSASLNLEIVRDFDRQKGQHLVFIRPQDSALENLFKPSHHIYARGSLISKAKDEFTILDFVLSYLQEHGHLMKEMEYSSLCLKFGADLLLRGALEKDGVFVTSSEKSKELAKKIGDFRSGLENLPLDKVFLVFYQRSRPCKSILFPEKGGISPDSRISGNNGDTRIHSRISRNNGDSPRVDNQLSR